MTRALAALAAGILFGFGLGLSRMVDPAKVLGFLDVAGAWDASLGLVMAGALAVTFFAYRPALMPKRPFLAEGFSLPAAADLDGRLIGGAVVFGIGWGLVGLCPGPAFASLAYGLKESLVFLAAMAGGMTLARLLPPKKATAAA